MEKTGEAGRNEGKPTVREAFGNIELRKQLLEQWQKDHNRDILYWQGIAITLYQRVSNAYEQHKNEWQACLLSKPVKTIQGLMKQRKYDQKNP